MADTPQPDYTSLTVQLLSAYVTNNIVPSDQLSALIQSTRAALIAETAPAPAETVEHVPAVSIRKSTASHDHILSLIDGRPYKTLKRHLAAHGLTPDSYRERYGLPDSYPMVARAYSEQRRAVAQKLGLGQRGTMARVAASQNAASTRAEPAPAAEATAPKARAKQMAAPAAATNGKAAKKDASATRKPKGAEPAPPAPAQGEPAKAKSPAKAAGRPKASRKTLGIKSANAAS